MRLALVVMPVTKPFLGAEDQSRVDEGEMSEGLGEVAELPEADRVVFLGEQPYVVAQVEEAFEQLSSLVAVAL